MHEIVTIQVGNQSNYLGTHFWNAQESYFTYGGEEQSVIDHDVHFRAGIGADGTETYTPRAIIYDLKPNFGTLRQTNALYELQHDETPTTSIWTSAPPTILQHQPAIPSHTYQQQLESGIPQPQAPSQSSIRFWSDFNRVFYHPRSLVQIRENATSLGARIGALDDWETGAELFDALEKEHGEAVFEHDVRPFVEECDQLQGLQIFTGVDDAWGGFGDKLVESVRDELGKGVVWVWGLEDGRGKTREKQLQQVGNLARSFQRISQQASLYIPVNNIPTATPPTYLDLDQESRWHTAALQSVAIESLTIPSRLRPGTAGRATLADMESIFTAEAPRNVLRTSLSTKNQLSATNGEINGVVNGGASDSRLRNGTTNGASHDETTELDISLFSLHPPPANRGSRVSRSHAFAQSHIQRGDWASPFPDHLEEPLTATLSRRLYTTDQLYPLPTSFPPIFNFDGRIPSSSLPIQAYLAATSDVAVRLRSIAAMVTRPGIVGLDEREDMYSELKRMAEEYVEGWESGDEEESEEE